MAKLEFRIVYPDDGERLREIDAGTEVIPPEYKIEFTNRTPSRARKPAEERLLVKKKADLGGEHVTEAHAGYGNEGWEVSAEFRRRRRQDLRQHHRGPCEPSFRDRARRRDSIGAQHPRADLRRQRRISGKFGEQEARSLASVLENPLQTPVSIEEERSVSPTLGQDSIRASIIAGLIGLALTLICVVIYYRFAGLIANLALLVNIVLLIGALTMFHFVLTLPGIAGIILTIGIAVDASVLIYERLREELALGKSLKVAVQAAYDKAFSSIFDANVTTLITAAILFWKASGPVKGFAISLTLGILASLFTALIVGRNLFSWFVDTGKIKRFRCCT